MLQKELDTSGNMLIERYWLNTYVYWLFEMLKWKKSSRILPRKDNNIILCTAFMFVNISCQGTFASSCIKQFLRQNAVYIYITVRDSALQRWIVSEAGNNEHFKLPRLQVLNLWALASIHVAAVNVLVCGSQLGTFTLSGKLGRTSQTPRFGTKVFIFIWRGRWGGGVQYIGFCLVVSSLYGRNVVPSVH